MLSPGIEAREGNVGTTVVRTTNGSAALVGKFNWGPAYQVVQVVDEPSLIERFGTPDNLTADYTLSAINFLKYGNDLRVVRALDPEKAKNSCAVVNSLGMSITAAGTSYAVGDLFVVKKDDGNTIEGHCRVLQVGTNGEILKAFIPSEAILKDMAARGLADLTTYQVDCSSAGIDGQSGTGATITTLTQETTSKIFVANSSTAEDALEATDFQTSIVKYNLPAVVAAYAGEYGNNIIVEIVSKADYDAKKPLYVYPDKGTSTPQTACNELQYGPQNENQYAIVVRDNGVMKEKYVVSTDPKDRDMYGANIFIDDFFANSGSRYISAVSKGWPVGFSGFLNLRGGVAANSSTDNGASQLTKGWDLFADTETQRIGLLIAGAVAGEGEAISSTVQKYAATIGEMRTDCLVLFSPCREHVVNKPVSEAIDKMVEWRTGQNSSGADVEHNMNVQTSYGAFDANYKYQYDKYNDVNRWIPFAADIAGLCARTDTIAYPWMSPAGYNRGQILDVIKVAVDTNQAHRDRLYAVELNPIISTTGNGVIMYGDKTATGQPTPFNRINVRRLSNMIKFDVSEFAKYKLYQNNDAFERADFRMSASQYMGNIRTLGGVYDYRVVCDETNNTPQVIDSNSFAANIFFKPSRSINYIQLNFVATNVSVNFDELLGPQQ